MIFLEIIKIAVKRIEIRNTTESEYASISLSEYPAVQTEQAYADIL